MTNNKFMNALINENNYTRTDNGAIVYSSTGNDLLNMFSLGGAYRSRSEEDCIFLFKKAYDENPTYALKCLFYLRDCRGIGQGERRFFRVCFKWLAQYDTEAVRRNMEYLARYGRWDDFFCLMDTKLENEMFAFLREQLITDVRSMEAGPNTAVSLSSKWMPSLNASSIETKRKATKFCKYLKMTPRQYRKVLSALRERINVLERLMSANRWQDIEFDSIPSKAGLKYRNAFARHDIERAKAGVQTYEDFIKNNITKVNTGTLYPYEVVEKAIDTYAHSYYSGLNLNNTERLAVNKYWDNLKDYLNGKAFNGLCVCDTSASMRGLPINVAISLSMYCAERSEGPFAGHYISFSRRPQLIKVEGIDFVDKVGRIYKTNLCENTNIEATFDMLLKTAINNHCRQDEIPQQLIIISDQEFDDARGTYSWGIRETGPIETLMEGIRRKWNEAGYEMPVLVFWNVDARNDRIPMKAEHGITFVSGFSPSVFEMVMDNKSPFDLMFSILDSKRYAVIE